MRTGGSNSLQPRIFCHFCLSEPTDVLQPRSHWGAMPTWHERLFWEWMTPTHSLSIYLPIYLSIYLYIYIYISLSWRSHNSPNNHLRRRTWSLKERRVRLDEGEAAGGKGRGERGGVGDGRDGRWGRSLRMVSHVSVGGSILSGVVVNMGSQHPSPNVKNPLRIRAANWLEIITSRDAKSACFQGSQTSCTEIISGVLFAKIWPKKITSRHGCVLLMNRR